MLCFFCIIMLQCFSFFSFYLSLLEKVVHVYNIKYKHIDFPDIKYALTSTKIARFTFSTFFQVSSLQNKLKILSCNRRKLIPWKKNKFCKALLFKKTAIGALIKLWISHSQYSRATEKKNSSNYYARLSKWSIYLSMSKLLLLSLALE